MFTALHATSTTLATYLQAGIDADPFFADPSNAWMHRSMKVRLQTPAEMTENGGMEGVSLWLYRVVRDEERLNEPPRRISPTELRPPPLPMRLHYLVTPLTNQANEGDPDTEQYLLGKILQLFHSKPLLRGADLRGEFVGTDTELGIRLETLSLEEISRVWEGLSGSYQLSVSYEVSLVDINAAIEPLLVAPVLVVTPELGLAAPVGGGV
jgi:hypothetical protein